MTESNRKKSIIELGALPPNPRNLPLSGQNGCFRSTTIKALERRVGLRRNATRAPTQAPEWRGGFGRPSFTFASAKLPDRPSVNQVRNMGWLFAGAFLLVAFGNLGIALRWYAHRKSGSFVPLVGGFSGVGACVTLPSQTLRHWWWIPLIVDLGSAYLVFATVVFLLRRAFKAADAKTD